MLHPCSVRVVCGFVTTHAAVEYVPPPLASVVAGNSYICVFPVYITCYVLRGWPCYLCSHLVHVTSCVYTCRVTTWHRSLPPSLPSFLPPSLPPSLPLQLEGRYKHLLEDQRETIQRERDEKESLVDKLQSVEQQLKSGKVELGECSLINNIDCNLRQSSASYWMGSW